MSQHVAWDTTCPAGALDLVEPGSTTVVCDPVLMDEWRIKLPAFLSTD